jgi:hypothetical protein
LKGTYATGAACQEELDRQFGGLMTRLQNMSQGGKNLGIGKLERTPSKYRWEVGFPSSRSVYEAWCEDSTQAESQTRAR